MSAPTYIDPEQRKLEQRKLQIRRAFAEKFPSPKDDLVLACLADENFAHRTTFHTDPRIHALQEGRRQAWLGIQHILKISHEDMSQLARTTERMRNE